MYCNHAGVIVRGVALPLLRAIAAVCVLSGAWTSRAEDSAQAGWTLVKEKSGLRVYHRYESPGDDVPLIRITGTLDIPYAAAGEFIWDPDLQLIAQLNEYVEQARTLPATRPGTRLTLYVFRVPWTARAAVRVGSALLGSVGSTQYTVMEMQMQPGPDETRIWWTQVPASEEVRKEMTGFEVLRNSGSWTLRPADGGARTAFLYELDAFPGGRRVPAGLVRWANNTSVRVPRLMEKVYHDRERDKTAR